MGWFKKLFFLLLIIIIAIAVFTALKPRVVMDLILGNDLTISLSSENKNLDLINGESGQVSFDFSVLTNAFCEVKCSSKVLDLGKGTIIKEEDFDIRPLVSKRYSADLIADDKGAGKSFYRFEVTCTDKPTLLCRGKGATRSRSLLIVMNRNLSQTEEQENILLQQSAASVLKKLNQDNMTASEINSLSNKLKFIDIKDESSNIVGLAEMYISSSSSFENLWKSQDYNALGEGVANMMISANDLDNRAKAIKIIFNSRVEEYNQLALILEGIRNSLNNIQNGAENATSYVVRYNDLIASSNENISNKISLANALKNDLSSINLNNASSDVKVINNTISKVTFSYSIFNESLISLNLGIPLSKCCLFGKCMSCCEECTNDRDKFPVILLHGHDFSRDASAEYALDAMDGLQRKLEEQGFLNAGPLLAGDIDSGAGSLAGPWPVTVKSSYYFDIYSGSEKTRVIETKTDNIDTYAVRLKDIIEVTKKKTNKEKVNIISHSMGGLVVRRYLQIFGTDSVDKVILIGSPNHGIEGNILKYCYVFGEQDECGDLDSQSLLISKVNSAPLPVNILNIVGDGCAMDGETGDGIVKKRSALLDGAANVIINGTCDESKFSYLHVDLLDLKKYPEVYTSIVNYLKA